MNEDSISAARTAADIRRRLGRIALEILIGFVGVYAAFALSAYKDRREQIDRRHQLKRALIAEIKPMTELARSNAPDWLVILAKFDSSVAGGNPAPRPFIETVGLTDHAWEAAKAAGGLNLIDVPTFMLLSQFYNMNSQAFTQYAQLRDFSIREILPRLGTGPNAFFIPGTKTLLPSFEIYRYALRRLNGMGRSNASNGDSLLVRLARDTI